MLKVLAHGALLICQELGFFLRFQILQQSLQPPQAILLLQRHLMYRHGRFVYFVAKASLSEQTSGPSESVWAPGGGDKHHR